MDVGIFSPMKATWKRLLKEYKTSTRAANVTKDVFPSLLDKLWATFLLPEHIKAGFRANGLFPLNAAVIPQYKVVPSIAVTEDVSVSTAVKEAPLRTEL